MNQSCIIQLTQASKEYPNGDQILQVLKPVDLNIYRHELLLIMGPSGSGKTTLLSLLGCVIYPSSGKVEVKGQDTTTLTEKQLAFLRLHGVGFIFQNYNLISPLSVLENVMFPLQLQGKSKAIQKKKAKAALLEIDLVDKASRLPKALSGGEQQRVAIARALVTNPEILLCDEPTGALDKDNATLVMQLLQKQAQAGKAVVVVTHDPRLKEYADRIIQVDDGIVLEK